MTTPSPTLLPATDHATDRATDWTREVWAGLDRAALDAFAAQVPRLSFVTLSGAHLYGFASPDSDVDLRGAFLLPARSLLGLRPPAETVTLEVKAPLELDLVVHDLRKFAAMLVRHNGYAMEQLFSPLVLVGGPLLEELRTLALDCLTRPTVRHFLGFASGRRHRLAEPGATVKHLLYAYRVLLSGLHLMEERRIEAHLGTLHARYGLPQVEALMERKRTGAERMELLPGEVEAHAPQLDALTARLERSAERSGLPLEPRGAAALEQFVIDLRLSERP